MYARRDQDSHEKVHEDDTKSYELHDYDTIYTDRVRITQIEYESYE